jgi:hypothetical protein
MHPTKRGHLFCKKIISFFAPNSAKRERFGIKIPVPGVLEIPTAVQFFVNRHRKSDFSEIQ